MKITWRFGSIFCLSILTNSLFSIATPAKGEVAEIKNPSRQEVPDTRIYNENQEIEPIYINVNGITRNGNVLTYDLVNPNFGYERSQTNFTDIARTHYQTGDKATESAQRIAVIGCQELTYRIEQLRNLNRPDGNF
jgi:hypothetical protein